MSNSDNEQVISPPSDMSSKIFKKPVALILAIVALILSVVSVGGYLIWNHINQLEQARIEQALRERQILEQKLEEERVHYEQARSEVLIDEFYEGISINGVSVAGLTLDEARKLLLQELKDFEEDLEYSVTLGEEDWKYSASDIGFDHNLDEVLNEAWKIGRFSGLQDEKSQIYDRQQTIQKLKTDPINMDLTYTYNKDKFGASLKALAENQSIEAVPAQITGFDVSSKLFVVSQHSDGLSVSAESVIMEIEEAFSEGVYAGKYELHTEVVPAPNADLASRVANLKLVSSAKTYAEAPDAPRDNNISLIVRALNGHVVMPGETFSFNGVIGRRTPEKGFQAAGAIFDGALVKTVGGGICQPNTTLYQAVLKADLKVIERHPHTFPSSYTAIGIDAAIDWGNQDMKFVNNTDYPVAIVAWYKKPEIGFQIYGRALPNGMSISLTTEVTANAPPEAPIEELVPTMEPGTRVQKRAPHNMIKARAWKIWSQNGEYVRSEEVYSSYYPPVRAKYEVGPPLPEVVEPETPPATPDGQTEVPADTEAPADTETAPTAAEAPADDTAPAAA